MRSSIFFHQHLLKIWLRLGSFFEIPDVSYICVCVCVWNYSFPLRRRPVKLIAWLHSGEKGIFDEIDSLLTNSIIGEWFYMSALRYNLWNGLRVIRPLDDPQMMSESNWFNKLIFPKYCQFFKTISKKGIEIYKRMVF